MAGSSQRLVHSLKVRAIIDPDPQTRETAVAALEFRARAFNEKGVIDALDNVYRESDNKTRSIAFESLLRLTDHYNGYSNKVGNAPPDANKVIVGIFRDASLVDPSRVIRRKAVKFLEYRVEKFGEDAALTALDHICIEGDADTRKAAHAALRRLGLDG